MPEKQHFCNKCGKDLDFWDSQEDFTIFKQQLGYGTIFDGEKLELRLCCGCLEEIVNSCVITPIIPGGGINL